MPSGFVAGDSGDEGGDGPHGGGAEEITMMYGDHMTGWGYAAGIISMILFWGVLIVAAVAAVRYLSRGGHEGSPAEPPAPASQPPRAEQVLAERFGGGEIDAGEYRQRLDTLRDGSGRGERLTRLP
jgi:putative membrane protein